MYHEKYLKYKKKYMQLKKELDSNLKKGGIDHNQIDISGNVETNNYSTDISGNVETNNYSTDISGNTSYSFFGWF